MLHRHGALGDPLLHEALAEVAAGVVIPFVTYGRSCVEYFICVKAGRAQGSGDVFDEVPGRNAWSRTQMAARRGGGARRLVMLTFLAGAYQLEVVRVLKLRSSKFAHVSTRAWLRMLQGRPCIC